MTNKTVANRYLTDKEWKDIEEIVKENEASEKLSYRISQATNNKTGKGRYSGYSFGRYQTDLGQHPEVIDELLDILKSHISEDEYETIRKRIGSKGNKTLMSGELNTKINKALQTKAGKALIDKWDKTQRNVLKKNIASVFESAKNNPRYKIDKEFKKFVNSTPFKAYVADSTNQYGLKRLKKFISGEETKDRIGKDILKSDEKLNLNRLFAFEKNRYPETYSTRKKKFVNALSEKKYISKDEVITDKEENAEKIDRTNIEQEEKKEQSKVVKEVIDEVKKVDNFVDEIMRKPVENWTEKEADEVGKKAMKEPNIDKKEKLDKSRKEFYKNHYPNETKKDEFGKMEKIEKAETIPKDEKPAETKDGKKLEKSVEKVAEKVGKIADKKDKKIAVVELQKGLNVLKSSNEKTITEDGKLGPKTRSTLKNTLMEKGEKEVVNSLKNEQEIKEKNKEKIEQQEKNNDEKKEEQQQIKQEGAEQKKQEQEQLADEKEQEKQRVSEEKEQEKISNLREKISKKEDKKSELEAVMREIEQESSQAKSEGESLVNEAENQKNSIVLQQDQIEDEEVRILEIRGKIESIREEKRAIAKQLEGLHLEEEKVKNSL